MGKKTIWAHTLVCNEENYVWFSVMSVVDHVDKVLLWDTGSTDNTVKIIKEIKKEKGRKIDFKERGKVDATGFTNVRQQMLGQSDCDWFLIVDGDEIWWQESIKTMVEVIQKDGNHLDSIVTPYFNIVGDIYHYQEEEAGGYQIDDRKGHFNIRAFNRKIPGLHFEKPHGQQGLFDGGYTLIQQRPKKFRRFLNVHYMHFTNVRRSSTQRKDREVTKRSVKFKYEIGKTFPKNFIYPEVFFRPSPAIVPNPWRKMKLGFWLKAALQTIPKKVKRRIFRAKSGY